METGEVKSLTDDVMICPKCGIEQASALCCSYCGIVISKYKAREEQIASRPKEAKVVRATKQGTGSLLHDLFTGPSARLLRIILLCAVPIVFFTLSGKSKKAPVTPVITVGASESATTSAYDPQVTGSSQ